MYGCADHLDLHYPLRRQRQMCIRDSYYKGGYKLLDVHDDRQYLIVPEGKKKPADLDKDIVVLKQPLDHIYLAATSACLLYTSDAADEEDSVDLGGRQII